jgi:hypothetical protein
MQKRLQTIVLQAFSFTWLVNQQREGFELKLQQAY